MKNFPWLISLLLLLFFKAASGQSRVSQDLPFLLAFKSSADVANRSLSSWVGANPCFGSWRGVKCRGGRISGILLDGASLVGNISSILQLPFLEFLSLRRNKLSGKLSPITALRNPNLRYIFLSHNQFNGSLEISLPGLISLRLEGNRFSGDLRGLFLPDLGDLNVSGNSLSGEIPSNLSKFPPSAFGFNLPSLCGDPLPPCIKNQTILLSKFIVKVKNLVIYAAVIGDAILISFLLSMVAIIWIWISRRNIRDFKSPETSREAHLESENNGDREATAGLICFQGGEDLKLDCLLKASAEVLGEGDAGGTYKAVIHDGAIVAVKRLHVSCFPVGKIFDQHIRLIAMVRHRNLVPLKAYYNASEEKLLIYDYLPNGSLRSLLQNRKDVNWNARKKIVLGAARGLDFIHNFPARFPLVHANFKPSNVLIDAGGEACVSEWGLMLIARNFRRKSPEAGWSRYRAPELLSGSNATQASDVYSFGMVLLEVVTDKEIGNGEAEEEVMKMVKIGMACTKENPEERPSMGAVVRLIAEL